MKFIVDECVGPSVARWLQEKDYDIVSVFDTMRGATDHMILQKAFNEKRILITSDKDFGDMIFKQKNNHCGVILLRLLDETIIAKISALEWLLKNYVNSLANNFVVVTEKTIRIITTTQQ
jgi:predicted nuclease of predicted toxin-antitoxin system